MILVRAFVCLALLAGSVAIAAAAPRPPAPRVSIELVSETQAVPAGGTFWIGLRQRITEGWHTYWINPGDAGEPTRIDWTMPAGFTAGDIAWPHPDRIPVGPAMSYGYSREVVLPIPITAPADLAPGTRVTLRGRVSWVVWARSTTGRRRARATCRARRTTCARRSTRWRQASR